MACTSWYVVPTTRWGDPPTVRNWCAHTHIYIERANPHSADPVYLDGMVWSASYALAGPRTEATGPEHRPE